MSKGKGRIMKKVIRDQRQIERSKSRERMGKNTSCGKIRRLSLVRMRGKRKRKMKKKMSKSVIGAGNQYREER